MKRFSFKQSLFCICIAVLAVGGIGRAQTLNRALFHAVSERIDGPVFFSTRDTLFALALPTDEPAEIYVQLTVGRNGKVKNKLTRVSANHIGAYVTPVFLSATKDLRVDRALLASLSGRDTSLFVVFPLQYQCIYDTVSKEWPNAGDYLRKEYLSYIPKSYNFTLNEPWWGKKQLGWGRPAYPYIKGSSSELIAYQMELESDGHAYSAYSWAKSQYAKSVPTPVWYYLAFITDKPDER